MRHLATALALLAISAIPADASTVAHWGSYLNGDSETQRRPKTLPGLTEATAVDAGNSSGYALRANGTVWAWGNGGRGQLGNGALTDSPTTPVKVRIPATVTSIGEARNEGMAVDSTGHAWVWGEDGFSSLCVPGGRSIATPMQVPGLSHVVAVQGGEEHTIWLTASGTVLACGKNIYGELGIGQGRIISRTPTEVPGLAGIVEVSAGDRTSAARNGKGRVFMWGYNSHGQVGVGSSQSIIWTPRLVGLPEPAKQISAGGDLAENGASLALTNSGLLYGWGDDKCGEIGDGQTVNKLSPVNTGLHFASAVTGGLFSLGLDARGNVYSWGCNIGSALGVGGSGTAMTPLFVESGVTKISATAMNAEDLHR
jgi:alpha-tubulin suppressor-like RCC1 family protein